eukprot:3576558-Rhodomonas_salina.2
MPSWCMAIVPCSTLRPTAMASFSQKKAGVVVDHVLHRTALQQPGDEPEHVLGLRHLARDELHHVGVLYLAQHQRLALHPPHLLRLQPAPSGVDQLHSKLLLPLPVLQPERLYHSPGRPGADALQRDVLLPQLLRKVLALHRVAHSYPGVGRAPSAGCSCALGAAAR